MQGASDSEAAGKMLFRGEHNPVFYKRESKMRERPKELEVYRHFKGRYYQVITIAKHTEYDEELVIYRPLFEQGDVYARPLSSFMSEVDRNIYPNARQQYRFTLASGENHGEKASKEENGTESDNTAPVRAPYPTGVYEEEPVKEEREYYDNDRDPDSILDPDLEAFLDEKSYSKKLDIFMFMRRKITDEMLNDIAVAMDISLTGDNLEDRYMEILDCIKTKKKYESDRLR